MVGPMVCLQLGLQPVNELNNLTFPNRRIFDLYEFDSTEVVPTLSVLWRFEPLNEECLHCGDQAI